MHRKATLEEISKMTDYKVFYNGEDKLNVLHFGKYKSGMTIVIKNDLYFEKNSQGEDKPISLFKFRDCEKITRNMNIDFDGDCRVLFGQYRESKTGKPVFEEKDPLAANQILIEVSWGGAFNGTRGQSNSYAQESGAVFFQRSSSNGGGAGKDYWVLPIDYVKDQEHRSKEEIYQIKKEVHEEIANEQKKWEESYKKTCEELENKEARNNIWTKEKKDSLIDYAYEQLKEHLSTNDQIEKTTAYKSVQLSVNGEALIDIGENNISSGYLDKSSREDLLKISPEDAKNQFEEWLSSHIEFLEKRKNNVDSLFKKEKTDKLNSLDIKERLSGLNSLYIGKNDSYDLTKLSLQDNVTIKPGHIESFIDNLVADETLKKIELERQQQEELRKKQLEIKKAEDEKLAKEAGYPHNFTSWHRTGANTSLGDTYVIDQNGQIRDPDDNDLVNPNHRYKYGLFEADGTWKHNQILPGELVVTVSKQYTAAPVYMHVVWAPGIIDNIKPSEAQIETLQEKIIDWYDSGLWHEGQPHTIYDASNNKCICDYDRPEEYGQTEMPEAKVLINDNIERLKNDWELIHIAKEKGLLSQEEIDMANYNTSKLLNSMESAIERALADDLSSYNDKTKEWFGEKVDYLYARLDEIDDRRDRRTDDGL